MNNSIWKKYDIWLNVGVFLVVITALVYFVVLPMKQRIADDDNNFKKKKIDNEMNAERIAKIPNMEMVHNIISEKRNELNIILDKNNELDLIEKLESLASETGNEISLQMEAVSPDDKPSATVAKKDDKGEKIEVLSGNRLVAHISLVGKYDQLFNFLSRLENMPYYVNVIGLDLKKGILDENNQDLGSSMHNSFTMSATTIGEDKKAEKEVLQSKIDAIVYLKN